MATLEELYRYYLNQPITYVPGSTIGGLSSLTEINRNDAGGDSMGASPVTSINTDPNVTNTTPGTGIMGTNINFSDIGKALGFAMNPTLGIANLVATQVFGRSPMDMAMEAMGIGGFGRTDSDFATAGVFGGDDSSSTGTANATDTGDMGSEAANNAATDAANASVGAGDGSSSDGGSTGSCGSFKKGGYITGASVRPNLNIGGRVGYAEGSSTLSREEIINRILGDIKNTSFANENSRGNMYPDDFKTGLDLDYLKTLNPDDIKLILDKTFLQGENFKNPDFTSGRIGGGNPFFRYDPQYMEKFNMQGSPLHLSEAGTGYNLRNQLGELESILGKEGIDPYITKLDDALIYAAKNDDLDFQKRIFGDSIMANEQTTPETPTEDFSDYLNTPTVEEQIMSPDDSMNQYDISNQMNEGQITSFDSIGNRLENIVNNPAIKGFTNFVTGSGNPFQDISQFTPSQQSVINQAIENAAKEGRTNITYADYPKTGVAQLADDGFSPMEYVKTLGSSIIGNPVDQIKTTLGQFAYDPQQQQIKDFYDFQKQSGNNLGTSYPININVSNPKEKLQQLPYMDQYQKDYQTRISQVDPNALRNRYLENLQNTSSQDINQFQSQLRSNLVPRENQPQGLDYLTGL